MKQVVAFVLALHCVATQASLLGDDCASTKTRILSSLGSLNKWRGPVLSENYFLKSPTKEFGTWVSIERAQGSTKIIKRHDTETLKFELSSKDCSVVVTPGAYQKSQSVAFTDAKLSRLLKKGRRGAILLWSPHMPISKKSVTQILDLSRKKKFDLVVLVDAHADFELATKQAGELGLATKYLQRAESIELWGRDMDLHYPSLIAFGDKKLGEHPRLGHTSAANVWAYLQDEWAKVSPQ